MILTSNPSLNSHYYPHMKHASNLHLNPNQSLNFIPHPTANANPDSRLTLKLTTNLMGVWTICQRNFLYVINTSLPTGIVRHIVAQRMATKPAASHVESFAELAKGCFQTWDKHTETASKVCVERCLHMYGIQRILTCLSCFQDQSKRRGGNTL